jgi:Glycosyl hydrolase family 12
MAAHSKSRKLVPLSVMLGLAVAAAFGGYVVAGSHAPETVNLAGASGSYGHTQRASLDAGGVSRASRGGRHRHAGKPSPSPSPRWSSPSPDPAPDPPPSSSSPPPSTVADPPSSSPPSTSAAPASSAPSGAPCVTSDLAGTCGPYTDSDITDADGYNTYVANNMWGCGSVQPGQAGAYCGIQTVSAYGPADWSVTSDQAAGNTGVLTYPDVSQVFTLSNDTDPPISGFSAITSSFTEAMNATAGTDSEAAYDIWLDDGNGPNEIMIWVDNHGQTPAGDDKGSIVIGGTTYELWNGGDTISFVMSNEQSGTVNILAVLNWLQSNGYVSSTADLGQVDFGWEICSTGGVSETFTISSYTLEDTCSSACSG